MSYVERPLLFPVGGDTLLGVMSQPAQPAQPEHAAPVAVLVIVGGPQYRAGSHRQFVHLARFLAAQGHPVLRFDVRGMGDSEGTPRGFESVSDDIGAAVDALLAGCAPKTRVVLWGLCDAAAAALLYLNERNDPRVAGVCLLNPWVRSPAGLARTQLKHYYLQRLGQKEFWVKLLNGGVHLTALTGLARNWRLARSRPDIDRKLQTTSFQDRMLLALRRFREPVLLLLSGEDYTAKEFLEFTAERPQWREVLRRSMVERHDLDGADHTFSTAEEKANVASLTVQWLGGLAHHA